MGGWCRLRRAFVCKVCTVCTVFSELFGLEHAGGAMPLMLWLCVVLVVHVSVDVSAIARAPRCTAEGVLRRVPTCI